MPEVIYTFPKPKRARQIIYTFSFKAPNLRLSFIYISWQNITEHPKVL